SRTTPSILRRGLLTLSGADGRQQAREGEETPPQDARGGTRGAVCEHPKSAGPFLKEADEWEHVGIDCECEASGASHREEARGGGPLYCLSQSRADEAVGLGGSERLGQVHGAVP